MFVLQKTEPIKGQKHDVYGMTERLVSFEHVDIHCRTTFEHA